MVRHARPREAAEILTNEDFHASKVAHQEYHAKCGWPKVVRTVDVDFNYQVLTVGSDWVVDSLNYQIPKEAEAVLGVKKCSGMREDDSNDGFVRRATDATSSANADILRVSSDKSGIFGDATRTSQCTWFLKKDGNGNGNSNDDKEPVCTQVEAKAAVLYDPELTDAEQATKKTMEAISEVVLMGGESRGGSSLVTGNIVGLRMVEKTDAAEMSDTKTVNVFAIIDAIDATPKRNMPIDNSKGIDATPKGDMPIDNSKGMSGGEIVGIVIGLSLLTGLMAMLVVWRRRQQTSMGHHLANDDDDTQYGRETTII